MFKSKTAVCSNQTIILMIHLCHLLLSAAMVTPFVPTFEYKGGDVQDDRSNEVALRHRLRRALKEEVVFSCEISDKSTSLTISLSCSQSHRCKMDVLPRGRPTAKSKDVRKRLLSLNLLSENCAAFNKAVDKYSVSQNQILELTFNIRQKVEFNPDYFCGLTSVINMTFAKVYFDEQSLRFGKNCSSSGCCVCKLKRLMINLNSDVNVIRNSAFCGMQNLTTLVLRNGSLDEIEGNAFLYLPSLQRLELQRNRLVTLSKELFRTLTTSLKYLDASRNKLKSEVLYSLQNLAELEDLILDYNSISLLSGDSFKGLQTLKRLSLRKNKLKELGEGFQYLASLEELNISSNAIPYIDTSTFNSLVNLTVLRLSGNGFSSVVDFISNDNYGLKLLDISANGITAIPLTLKYFKNLTDLQMAHNNINAITESDKHTLCNITNLQSLSLLYNNISNIYPGAFDCLVNLRILNLNKNILTSIVAMMDSMVTHLYVSYNKILNIVVDDFPPHLVYLDASHNKLTEFHFQYRNSTTSGRSKNISSALEVLILSHNVIQRFSIDECPRTAVLHHSNNTQQIYKNNCLPYIDLSFNYIQSICPFLLKIRDNRMVPILNFNANQLFCSCEMRNIRKKYNSNVRLHVLHVDLCCGFLKYASCPEFSLGCLLKGSKAIGQRVYGASDRTVMTQQRFSCLSRPIPSCNFHRNYSTICGLPCPSECDCFISNEYDLYVIDCSNADLTYLPNHHQMNITTIVKFTNNYLSFVNVSTLSPYSNAVVLDLSKNNLTFITNKSFTYFTKLENLILSYNLLSEISLEMFFGLERLKALDLSYNVLANIHQGAFLPLASLQKLNIGNNQFNLISSSELTNLKSLVPNGIDLSSNPWNCADDVDFDFRCWFDENSVLVNRANDLKCWQNGTVVSLISFNNSFCYTAPVMIVDHTNSNVAVWTSVVSVLTFLTTLAIVLYIYRDELQVLIYSRYGVRLFHKTQDADTNKKYDVFIAYSSVDEAFVFEQLLPGLEQIENPYKVCIHDRDFIAGSLITDNIVKAVELSRRTLVVLSENFVQSGFCRLEFKSAHYQMLTDKCTRLIVLLLGKIPRKVDPEMKSYLKTNSYIKWGDRLFWEKLYFALPNRTLKIMESSL